MTSGAPVARWSTVWTVLRIASEHVLDGSSWRVVRWQNPRLRVYAIRTQRVVFESLPLAPRGALVSPLLNHQITCVLRGELVSRRASQEHTARPGLALVEPTMTWNERWMGATFEALLIDWDPALLPIRATETRGCPVLSVDAVSLRRSFGA